MLIVFATILLFYMGPLEDVITTPLPILWIIYGITGSKTAANVLIVFLAVVFFLALFNIFASVSRLVWVFARDNGLPFSSFFAYVSKGELLRNLSDINAGPSNSPTSRKRPASGRIHRHGALPDLHRKRDRLQRAHLPTGPCATHLVLLPDPLHFDPKDPRPDSALRTVQHGQSRDAHQRIRAMLHCLRRSLDALPADPASDERQHELRRTDFRGSRARRFGALVSPCQENVSDANHKVRMSVSGSCRFGAARTCRRIGGTFDQVFDGFAYRTEKVASVAICI